MRNFLKKNLLALTIFITGACVLVVEVVATRILSPFFGNTIFTVSSVISIILAALSLGYYFGGRIADKKPSKRLFFFIILASGLTLILIHYLQSVLLPVISKTFSLTWGPLISSSIFFFLPAFLLGMLSPFSIKLQSLSEPKQGIGKISGNMFFWSTLGSIVGSLSAGFYLIPHFGIDQIMIGNGILLSLLGFIPIFFLKKDKYIEILLLFAALLASSLMLFKPSLENTVYSKDGIYEKISIYDGQKNGRPVRFFAQDLSSSGAMYLDNDDPKDLVYEYTKYYSIYKVFNENIKNALVIGGGAYTIPKALKQDLPDAKIDVSEIEPSLLDLSKKYFKLNDTTNIHSYTEDGRRLLEKSTKKYDYIFSDVYYSIYSVPPHFVTKEFFTNAKDKMSDDGIFIANMIGSLSRQKRSLTMSEIKTFQEVFPNSYFFGAESPNSLSPQNLIFVGYKSDRAINLNDDKMKNNPDSFISSLAEKNIDLKRFDLTNYLLLTDNYTPVEYLTGLELKKKTLISGKEMLGTISQQLGYGFRYPTAEGHALTKDFLEAEMRSLADGVNIQRWTHNEPNNNSYELTNIIARFNPDNKNRVILATHYDSQKYSFNDKLNQSAPTPGANNSASGVAVLVELARELQQSIDKPNIGIDFVFFDGEEGEESQGSDFKNWKPLGSTFFSERIQEIYPNDKPKSAVVLDMVCKENLKIFQEQSSVKNAGKIVDDFWSIGNQVNRKVFINSIGKEIKDDHSPLNQIGIPSILINDLDYKYYATVNDTVDKCSVSSLQTVLEATKRYIYSLQ